MNDKIYQALSIFLDAMRQFTVSLLQKHFPSEPWEGVFYSRLTPSKQDMWNQAIRRGADAMSCIDYHNMTFLGTKFRDELQAEVGNDRQKASSFKNALDELNEVRNKCQHFTPLTEFEQERAFSNMKLVANILEMPELLDEIKRLSDLRHQPTAPQTPVQTVQTAQPIATVAVSNNAPLTPWWDNCIPHYDIRNGNLDESIFAANLNEVALGAGPEVYTNPTMFFAKTFVTAGLHDIANRVIQALNGQETENRVISLQTGFGGGKTHTLISLYHIIKGGKHLLETGACVNILSNGIKPEFDNAKVVVFTNNTTDVSQGRVTPEGFTIYTLWGEIAYQLGGVEGYEKMKQNDIDRIAPSSSILKPIVEAAGTSMILIDELADYCVKASAKKVGAGNLYNQTNSFIQTLTEVISSVPKSVLIATLPASKTEVADSVIGQQILDSLQERIVRVGTHVKPVDDNEMFEVVRRRLFEELKSPEIVEAVTHRYKDMIHNRRTDLPVDADRADYAKTIRSAYPFHPELIKIIRDRWGSDSRFQRTRGVLRLLASIVQDLWKRRANLTGSHPLIQTSDVYLENLPTFTGTITNLMGANWESVMLADVYGVNSNARKIDEQDPSSTLCTYRLTQSIATTLLLASVGRNQKGLDMKALKLCLLRPAAFSHNDINGSLDKLEQVAHYLHSSKGVVPEYWFESKANINILLAQAKSEIKPEQIESEILRRLNNSLHSNGMFNILIAPSGEVPEQRKLSIVVMHPKYAVPIGSLTPALENAVKTIALKRGNSDRVNRNTILYLVSSEAGRSALSNKVREYLACNKILAEYEGRLDNDQKRKLNERKTDFNRQSDDAIVRAYNTVLKCSAMKGIDRYEMRNTAADIMSQISITMRDELKEEGVEWLIDRIGRNLLSRNNLLPTVEHPVRVKDVYEAFLRFDDKPMITGPEAIVETVNKYCNEGMFNVAMGTPGHYHKIYESQTIPFLDANDAESWLVDTSVKPAPAQPVNPPVNPIDPVNPPIDPVHPQPPVDPNLPAEPKKYSKITIGGHVPVENYTQLFTSFINVLKSNRLDIEIKFTAKSTTASPLAENSQIVKSVKESASQLGLNFEAEE